MATRRPVAIPPGTGAPKDDGYFGPGSVTWRVFAAPSEVVGATAAVLAQMLLPRVVWIIDQSSAVYTDAETRGRLTTEYGLTVTFADTQAAERAGTMLRNIHHSMRAVDPFTDEAYNAGEPDLLLYVHNCTVWALVRGCDRWGPKLTRAEKDRFVAEQKQAARLVGIDPALAPSTVAEAEAYMEQMRAKMAFTPAARRFMDLILPPTLPRSKDDLITSLLMQAAVDLLTPEMRELYGLRWGPVRRFVVTAAATVIMGMAWAKLPYRKALPAMRAQVAVHSFGGKVRKAKEAAANAPAAAEREPVAELDHAAV